MPRRVTIVALLGPDGAGKSTLAEALQVAFRGHGLQVETRHLTFGTIRRRQNQPPIRMPHAKPARGTLASFLKLTQLTIDYYIGFAVRVFTRSTPRVVILDRCLLDLAVDPLRYRSSSRGIVIRALWRILPGRRFVFVLDLPPAVTRARVVEVSASESFRQRAAYLELVQQVRGASVLNGPATVPALVDQVVRKVLAED